MVYVKKFVFGLLFSASFIILIYQLVPFLSSYDLIFSLSLSTLIQLIIIAALVSVSSLFFSVFTALAVDWKLVLPVGILATLSPLLFWDTSLAVVFATGVLVSLLLIYLSLNNSLKSYLTFKPEAILGPSIRHLSSLLILCFCLIYFFSTSKIIAQKGFQIPDSLIDTALQIVPLPQPAGQTEQASLSQITPDQLDLLRKNPELLKQSGLDPKILDTLSQPKSAKAPQNLTNDLIKQTVKDQIQNFIKPYINFIPAILAVLLFLTLQSLTSILNLLVSPLLWLIFLILEKTGFVKFEVEQRTVRKMVV